MTYLVWSVSCFGGAALTGWGIGGRSVERLPRKTAWPMAVVGAALFVGAMVYLISDLA